MLWGSRGPGQGKRTCEDERAVRLVGLQHVVGSRGQGSWGPLEVSGWGLPRARCMGTVPGSGYMGTFQGCPGVRAHRDCPEVRVHGHSLGLSRGQVHRDYSGVRCMGPIQGSGEWEPLRYVWGPSRGQVHGDRQGLVCGDCPGSPEGLSQDAACFKVPQPTLPVM